MTSVGADNLQGVCSNHWSTRATCEALTCGTANHLKGGLCQPNTTSHRSRVDKRRCLNERVSNFHLNKNPSSSAITSISHSFVTSLSLSILRLP